MRACGKGGSLITPNTLPSQQPSRLGDQYLFL